MLLFDLAVTQPTKMLRNLDKWLDKAVAHAEDRKFDPELLLATRLVPNMFSLTRQIQAACDAAKVLPARLAGKTPPSHPDEETTLAELRARIQAVIAYLDTFAAADLDGGEDRIIELPFAPGQVIRGADYAVEMALPNFYFHMTTAYDLLRHNGVDLGKRDYIGSLNLKPAT